MRDWVANNDAGRFLRAMICARGEGSKGRYMCPELWMIAEKGSVHRGDVMAGRAFVDRHQSWIL